MNSARKPEPEGVNRSSPDGNRTSDERVPGAIRVDNLLLRERRDWILGQDAVGYDDRRLVAMG